MSLKLYLYKYINLNHLSSNKSILYQFEVKKSMIYYIKKGLESFGKFKFIKLICKRCE